MIGARRSMRAQASPGSHEDSLAETGSNVSLGHRPTLSLLHPISPAATLSPAALPDRRALGALGRNNQIGSTSPETGGGGEITDVHGTVCATN